MAEPREKLTQAGELELLIQVQGYCPLCRDNLFHTKKTRTYRSFEVAHIYPLNPRSDEEAELFGAERLSSDPNHLDNLIPLCTTCHNRFDKPRTREEYNELVALKRSLIERVRQHRLGLEYPLESQIDQLICSLATIEEGPVYSSTDQFDVKSMTDKFDDSLTPPTRRKIRHAVSDYYIHIKRVLKELERDTPLVSEIIAIQVKAYYIKQKSLGHDQQVIFQNIVQWLRTRTSVASPEPAEIVTSYFVQNCEVFE